MISYISYFLTLMNTTEDMVSKTKNRIVCSVSFGISVTLIVSYFCMLSDVSKI